MTVPTVLIVDDQPEIRKVLDQVLTRDGRFATAEAADGTEALSIVAASPPDAIILDLTMPGQNGVAVIAPLLDLAPSTKIVVVSSHFAMEEEVLALGAHAFLPKSMRPKDLIRTLTGLLDL